MKFPMRLLFILPLFLFFSCHTYHGEAEKRTEKPLEVLVQDDSLPVHFAGNKGKFSPPEIIAIPVETHQPEVRKNHPEPLKIFYSSFKTSYPGSIRIYLYRCFSILPGLSSTRIVYPFHAFW